MAVQRIKGQEVEVLLVVDGQVQDTLTAVKSTEITREFETTEEGYLGEKGDRYDEFYKGYSGSMELHFGDAVVFDFMQAVQDRAQRRTPGTVINIKVTLNFPSGQRRRVMLQDAHFDSLPMSFSGRGEYGTVTLPFKGADVRVI